MRLGEILALEWSDLDENQKVIRVNKSARRVKGGMEVNPPKTQASIRTITISDECLRLLIALRNRQPVGTKLMFPSPVTGSYYDPKAVTKKLHKLQERAGIPQIRFHDLRHPYVKLKTKKFEDFYYESRRTDFTLPPALALWLVRCQKVIANVIYLNTIVLEDIYTAYQAVRK